MYIDLWLLVDVLKYAALIVWSSYSINVILGMIGRYFYKVKRSDYKTTKLELVLVSVANKKVKKSLFETVNHTLLYFRDVQFNIVVDEGAELLEDLIALARSTELEKEKKLRSSSLKIIIVPNEYNKNLLAKGRAMNYFIENVVRPDKWYTFFDDDNLLMDDRFVYEIPYYEKLGYVACNPVVYTRQGRSILTTVMDWIRFFEDITVFRFFTGVTKRPWIGLHGEMLTVRGDILKEIGYTKSSIAEDFYFATRLIIKKYKVWQSDTRVSLRPPNNIKDLCKQRARWFKGIWMDIKDCPLPMRIIVGYRMISWTMGIFGSWLFSPLWIFWFNDPLILFEIAIGGFWTWVLFVYSIIKTRQPLRYILYIPIFGVIESMAFWMPYNTKKFVVIDKN
jgi:egghead protein (zeste-white 4 protein)